jgi:hypothetical protein
MKGIRIGTGIVMSLTSRLSDMAACGHTVRP